MKKKRSKPMEIKKQSVKSIKGIRDALTLLQSSAKTNGPMGAHASKLIGAVRKRYGIRIKIRATKKSTYISPDYLHSRSTIMSINLYTLAKQNKNELKKANMANTRDMKFTGNADYTRAMITGKAAGLGYTIYINKKELAKMSQATMLNTYLRLLGSAWHMSASNTRIVKAKTIVARLASDTYTPKMWIRDLKVLKALGVITTAATAKTITDLINTNKGKAGNAILKKIKTNIVDRTPKGGGFSAAHGSSKQLASLEDKTSISPWDVLVAIFAVWVMVQAISLIILGVLMMFTVVFMLPGILFVWLGAVLLSWGKKRYRVSVGLDKSDDNTKVTTKIARLISKLRHNGVLSSISRRFKRKRKSTEAYGDSLEVMGNALIDFDAFDFDSVISAENYYDEDVQRSVEGYNNAMLDYKEFVMSGGV